MARRNATVEADRAAEPLRPDQSVDEVKGIDRSKQEVVETISAGSEPYGATAGNVRPKADTARDLPAIVRSDRPQKITAVRRRDRRRSGS